MANPIYQAMQANRPMSMPQAFQQFMAQNRGKNPTEILNRMISSGRIDQRTLNQAQAMAQGLSTQLSGMRGMFGF